MVTSKMDGVQYRRDGGGGSVWNSMEQLKE